MDWMPDIVKNNVWTTVWIVCLIAAIVLCALFNDKIDPFYNDYGYYKRYCPSCGWRGRNSCSSCTNCGYCVTASGYGECVPGDSSGPYFRDDCTYWEYGDPYYNYPNSHAYPVIQVKDVYPYYRWNLRKGRWGWGRKEVGERLKRQARANRELRARLKASQI